MNVKKRMTYITAFQKVWIYRISVSYHSPAHHYSLYSHKQNHICLLGCRCSLPDPVRQLSNMSNDEDTYWPFAVVLIESKTWTSQCYYSTIMKAFRNYTCSFRNHFNILICCSTNMYNCCAGKPWISFSGFCEQDKTS